MNYVIGLSMIKFDNIVERVCVETIIHVLLVISLVPIFETFDGKMCLCRVYVCVPKCACACLCVPMWMSACVSLAVCARMCLCA